MLLSPEIIKVLRTIRNRTNEVCLTSGKKVIILFPDYFIFVKLKSNIDKKIYISDLKKFLKFAYSNKNHNIYYKRKIGKSIFYTEKDKIELKNIKRKDYILNVDIRRRIKRLENDNTLFDITFNYDKAMEIFKEFKDRKCLKNIVITTEKCNDFFTIKAYSRNGEYEQKISVSKPFNCSFTYYFYIGKNQLYVNKDNIQIKLIKSKINSKSAYLKLIQPDNIQLISAHI